MGVKISKGNIKMGSIPSVSLPAVITCRDDCGCGSKCYASRMERLRPNIRYSYLNNLRVLLTQPEAYWSGVEEQLKVSDFFRFHVSGDIVDDTYFANMVDVAKRNPHCEMLCFTKKYSIVNDFLSAGGKIPENLHIVFSGWRDLEMENPYNLPESHVRFRDGITEARADAKECGGNCTECANTNGGCWTLKSGEQIVFNEH